MIEEWVIITNIETFLEGYNNIINTLIMNEMKNQIIYSEDAEEDDDGPHILLAPIEIIYQADSEDD